MDAQAELSSLLTGGSRVIVISERDVDLRSGAAGNRLLLLRIAEGSLAAGGRGGGFGERKVVEVMLLSSAGGAWAKLFDSSEESTVARFDVPYHVARIPMVLADGTESMGYGVVEPGLADRMLQDAGVGSSS